MLDNLTKELFAENINTEFNASLEGGNSIKVQLIEVEEINPTPQQEQLSVIFRGPVDVPLQQNIYNLEHEKLGQFDLFLVPIGIDKEGRLYEAFFNRFRK